VADGLGGLCKGDMASSKAVQTIQDFIIRSRRGDVTWPSPPCEGLTEEENRFLAAVQLANREIFSAFQKDPENFIGMGTTLTGMLVHKDEAIMAHVGDSRAYQIRDGYISQLTQDHTVVMEEVRKGRMSIEEARYHPQKHVLTQALGVAEDVSVDIFTCPLRDGDIYLLCSDGLTDLLTDEEILGLISSKEDAPLPLLARDLVKAANERGGLDNITVVLVRFHAQSGRKPVSEKRSLP